MPKTVLAMSMAALSEGVSCGTAAQASLSSFQSCYTAVNNNGRV